MPTLPSTYLSCGDGVIAACHLPDIDRPLSGTPTPDPDLDELVLVSVVTGDGVGAITLPSALPSVFASADRAHVHARAPAPKPRLSLADLTLHSPSSILGTPFDVSSPRFEYPFPPSAPAEPEVALPPSILNPLIPFAAGGPPSCAASPPPPYTYTHAPHAPPGHARSYSATHPRHVPRDTPVPPTLARKRRGVPAAVPDPPGPATQAAPARCRGRPRSSSISPPPEPERVPACALRAAQEAQRRFASEERELRDRLAIASPSIRAR